MKAIIPCAGFGTRLDMKPNESKEMLWDTWHNERVIDFSLDASLAEGITPLVIIRPEKTDLIEYLKTRNVEMLIVEPGKEWAETVLKSMDRWDDHNVLILPDTRFSPVSNTLRQIKYHLEVIKSLASIAMHTVEDGSKWCVYDSLTLQEKPNSKIGVPCEAFGLIGFEKYTGGTIFMNIATFKSSPFDYAAQFIKLDWFQDLTREKNERLIRK